MSTTRLRSMSRSRSNKSSAAAGVDAPAAATTAAAPAEYTEEKKQKAYVPPSQRKLAADQPFFWCDGEPDLNKVSSHLDVLTANDLQLRSTQNALSESISSIQSTLQSVLDQNARLKREMREQKLASNRRWVWAVVILIAYTLGQSTLKSSFNLLLWALTAPQEFFPAMLEFMSTMSLWMFGAAFPLALLLFVHQILNRFSNGKLSLPRTGLYLVLGIAMQVPLLWYLMNSGVAQLANLQAHPIFASGSTANHIVTVGVWLATALLDYVLIVLHLHVE